LCAGEVPDQRFSFVILSPFSWRDLAVIKRNLYLGVFRKQAHTRARIAPFQFFVASSTETSKASPVSRSKTKEDNKATSPTTLSTRVRPRSFSPVKGDNFVILSRVSPTWAEENDTKIVPRVLPTWDDESGSEGDIEVVPKLVPSPPPVPKQITARIEDIIRLPYRENLPKIVREPASPPSSFLLPAFVRGKKFVMRRLSEPRNDDRVRRLKKSGTIVPTSRRLDISNSLFRGDNMVVMVRKNDAPSSSPPSPAVVGRRPYQMPAGIRGRDFVILQKDDWYWERSGEQRKQPVTTTAATTTEQKPQPLSLPNYIRGDKFLLFISPSRKAPPRKRLRSDYGTTNPHAIALWNGYRRWKTVSLKRPDLVKEWHWSRNRLSPDDVRPTDKKKFWWRCHKNPRHTYQATAFARCYLNAQCPHCRVWPIAYTDSLAALHPDLASQWHPTKNSPHLCPANIAAASNQSIWWQCLKRKGHVWRTDVANRSLLGSGCPFCEGTRLVRLQSLRHRFKAIASELHPSLNGDLTADQLHSKSSKPVWWRCDKGHTWRATVRDRTQQHTACVSHSCTFSSSLLLLCTVFVYGFKAFGVAFYLSKSRKRLSQIQVHFYIRVTHMYVRNTAHR